MLDEKRNLRRFAASVNAFKEDEGASLWSRCAAVGGDHGDGDGVSPAGFDFFCQNTLRCIRPGHV